MYLLYIHLICDHEGHSEKYTENWYDRMAWVPTRLIYDIITKHMDRGYPDQSYIWYQILVAQKNDKQRIENSLALKNTQQFYYYMIKLSKQKT